MVKRIKSIICHYFFPHESNNFKAKALHFTPLLFYVSLLLLVQIINVYFNTIKKDVLGYATSISVEQILELVNQKRKENNLKELTLSQELTIAATQKAADMFTKDYWAHISPTGVTPWQFIASSGYEYLYAGENLAKNFDKSSEVVEAWMKSPTHRANILKPEYTEIGIAVMNGKLNGEETTLVVQEFGTRAVSSLAEKSKIESTYLTNEQLAEMSTSKPLISEEKQADYPAGISLTEDKPSSKLFFSFNLSKTVSLLLAEFLLIVLLVDSIIIWRQKIVRISGHSIAHVIFFVSLLAAMGVAGVGVIL